MMGRLFHVMTVVHSPGQQLCEPYSARAWLPRIHLACIHGLCFDVDILKTNLRSKVERKPVKEDHRVLPSLLPRRRRRQSQCRNAISYGHWPLSFEHCTSPELPKAFLSVSQLLWTIPAPLLSTWTGPIVRHPLHRTHFNRKSRARMRHHQCTFLKIHEQR